MKQFLKGTFQNKVIGVCTALCVREDFAKTEEKKTVYKSIFPLWGFDRILAIMTKCISFHSKRVLGPRRRPLARTSAERVSHLHAHSAHFPSSTFPPTPSFSSLSLFPLLPLSPNSPARFSTCLPSYLQAHFLPLLDSPCFSSVSISLCVTSMMWYPSSLSSESLFSLPFLSFARKNSMSLFWWLVGCVGSVYHVDGSCLSS